MRLSSAVWLAPVSGFLSESDMLLQSGFLSIYGALISDGFLLQSGQLFIEGFHHFRGSLGCLVFFFSLVRYGSLGFIHRPARFII